MGIPRLRFPASAPSRSTLKLDEAFLFFLTESQRTASLTAGSTAVDLGASPGGWTYQFVQRSIYVIAIDNANMDKNLMESGLVNHIQTDGFKYVPQKPVEWMVCDMVEKPSRIINLVSHWAIHQLAHQFIFNLKLPMKKRYEEVTNGLMALENNLREHGINYILQCKHLYHDREEVTVWLKLKQ